MHNKEKLDRILSGTVAVLGLGISNLPLLEFLLKKGAKSISARDQKPFEALPEEVRALKDKGVSFVLGEGYTEGITEDTVFRSPGIRPDLPALEAVRRRGGCVTSEMELFFELCPATVLGITGSDGKTTTTTLTARLLSMQAEAEGGAFRVFLGGNIGTPLLPRVDEMTERDFAVVELSSFQLMSFKRAPDRAVVTNITPNHLNWHKDYAEYIEAKKRILPARPSALVLNADNKETAAIARALSGTNGEERPILFSSRRSYSDLHARFGEGRYLYLQDGHIVYTEGSRTLSLLRVADIKIPGRHNVENYMAAAALTMPFVKNEALRRLAPAFLGVAHRLQFVRTVNGVRYYNSSIDSSPNRTRASLLALEEKPIVICGGAAKGLSFASLADTLITYAKAVVLTGATARAIEAELRANPLFDEKELPLCLVPDFRGAVLSAAEMAKAGDTVLLSPACTSFDAFRNFEERGEVFCRIVSEIPENVGEEK